MRDKNRIPVVLDEMREVWEQFPDLRFMQLMYTFMEMEEKDLFYMEDEDFIKEFKDFWKLEV